MQVAEPPPEGHVTVQSGNLSGGRASSKQPPLPNLTALRFFAALLVLGYHYSWNGAGVSEHKWYQPLLSQGFLGVPMFFVLSGFVLAYSHGSVARKRDFYLARFARVYPLHLATFLLMLPIAVKWAHLAGHPPLWAAIPAAVLLLQTWFPSLYLFGNPPSWTLSVEALFYVTFPLLLPWVVRELRRRYLWILTLWVAFTLPPLFAAHPAWVHALGIGPRYSGYIGWVLPPSFLGEFVMGMFAGAYFRRHPQTFSGLAVLCAVMLSVAGIYISSFCDPNTMRDSGVAIAFLVLIYVLAGWKSPLLASRPMQLGGEISFSLYLLQHWVREVCWAVPWDALHHNRTIVPILFVCAWLGYVGIEKPARKYLLRVGGVRGGAKPIPTPVSMP